MAPASQTTQMIAGTNAATDTEIVGRATALNERYRLRRVYYSAFSPTPDASFVLPLARPPLMREHWPDQADWMAAAAGADGHFALDIDPKPAWPLRHRGFISLDVNKRPTAITDRVDLDRLLRPRSEQLEPFAA